MFAVVIKLLNRMNNGEYWRRENTQNLIQSNSMTALKSSISLRTNFSGNLLAVR